MGLFDDYSTKGAKRTSVEHVHLVNGDQPNRERRTRVRLSAEERQPGKTPRRKRSGQPLREDQMHLAEKYPNQTHLTTRQAAYVLGLSSKTLENWRVKGCGPMFVRFGRSVRYRYAELRRWAAKHSLNSTSAVAGQG